MAKINAKICATKVLMFGWEFPPHNTGGLGPACLGMTQALAKLGINLTFVLPRKLDYGVSNTNFLYAPDSLTTVLPDEPIEDLQNLSINVVAINSALWPYAEPQSYLDNYSNFTGNARAGQQILYAPNLEAEVQRYALVVNQVLDGQIFDIIHAHDWLTFPAAMRAQRITQKPLVVHIHSTEIDRSGNHGNSRIFEIEKAGMEAADQVITVSEHTKDVVMKYYGISGDKIVAIHNGPTPLLDISNQSEANHLKLKQSLEHFKQNGYNLVLFVGRLTHQKGVEYLLKAAQKVSQFQPKTIFVIAGSGDMSNYLIHLSALLGISDKVIFPGFVRGQELEALYQMCDLFVMPSVSEPFGLVGLESILNRTPIIISKTSGVGEIIQNALKVDFWDVDETANLIVSVLDNNSLKQTLTNFGYHEAQTITWDKAGVKIQNLYNHILDLAQANRVNFLNKKYL